MSSASLFLKIKANRIDAIALPRLRRSVIENVPQVRAAARAGYLCAPHAVCVVGVCLDGTGKGLVEARPAGA